MSALLLLAVPAAAFLGLIVLFAVVCGLAADARERRTPRPHFLRRARMGRALTWAGLLALPAYCLVVSAWLTWGYAP